jgi:hypothetical protein
VALAAAAGGYFLVTQLLQGPYLAYLEMLPWSLAAGAAYSMGCVPHFVLFACHRDRAITLSRLAELSLFVAISLTLSSVTTVAVPLGMTSALAAGWLLREIASQRLVRASDRRTEGNQAH